MISEILLRDISPKDKPWDGHKEKNLILADYYAGEDDRKRERMRNCGGYLEFEKVVNTVTGEEKSRLARAHFCRVRTCPICQWRRSLLWMARFHEHLPDVMKKYPDHSFIFLTLTQKNCDIRNLRAELKAMSLGWGRLVKRTEFKIVDGFVRTTEITRGKDGSAHPHFHVMLMVPRKYFDSDNYVTQKTWVQLWRSCMGLDYDPSVRIRKVDRDAYVEGQLPSAIKEVLKYTVKEGDLVADKDWFLEYSRQVANTRAIATGGIIKNILKGMASSANEEEPANDELIHLDKKTDPLEKVISTFQVGFNTERKRYVLINQWLVEPPNVTSPPSAHDARAAYHPPRPPVDIPQEYRLKSQAGVQNG
jgi:plasmid rolling circle replication initiator protein Rep